MPSVTADDVLIVLRTFLVGQPTPFLRRPDTPGTLPPLLIEPDGGPRQPSQDTNNPEDHDLLVVSATFDTEVVVPNFDRWRRPVVVAFTYLSRTTKGLRLARAVDDRIARALVRDRPDFGYGWTMGVDPASIRVIESAIFGGLSSVATEEGGRNRQVARYLITVPTA